MTKDEFVFCIGYDGSNAIVDRDFLISNKNKSVEELLEAGFYRAAFSKALLDSDFLVDYVVREYNKVSGFISTKDDLKLFFGVFYSGNIEKIKVIYI